MEQTDSERSENNRQKGSRLKDALKGAVTGGTVKAASVVKKGTENINKAKDSAASVLSKGTENISKVKDSAVSILSRGKSSNKDYGSSDFDSSFGSDVSERKAVKEATVMTTDKTMNDNSSSKEVLESPGVKMGLSSVVTGHNINWLTDDPNFVTILTLSLALYPTWNNWTNICRNEIPLCVMILWMLVAFFGGQSIKVDANSRFSLGRSRIDSDDRQTTNEKEEKIMLTNEEKTVETKDFMEKETKNQRLFGIFDTKKIRSQIRPMYWTVTRKGNESRKRFRWQRDIDPTLDNSENNFLLNSLLGYKRLRRTNRNKLMQRISANNITIPEDATPLDDNEIVRNLGKFKAADSKPSSFEEEIVEPFFILRGVDVFISDDPESECGSHPWLIEQGLRDVPTLIINMCTQWGNMLIYYDMSEWIKDWNMTEDENDPEDVKALKRFFTGTDEYRNKRLKVIQSLVDGPLAVRIVSRPKTAKVIQTDNVPVTWTKYSNKTTKGGKAMCVAMEATVDLMATRKIRTAASLIKNHIQKLVVDAALIIGTPEGQTEEEPMVCIGYVRFNHIDALSCPSLPDRYAEEAKNNGVSPSALRASMMVGMKQGELQRMMSKEILLESLLAT